MPDKKMLFKYRSFSAKTVESLVCDRLYMANPADFNDPMDTRPVVECDIDLDSLQELVATLIERRLKDELTKAAEKIRYRGPKTFEQIDRLSLGHVQKTLNEVAYNATNPDYENADEASKWMLVSLLEKELLQQYTGGVFSMAEKANCPLMWSHYGDQHRGLCIGYSIAKGWPSNLYQVEYGGSRLIKTSLISRVIDGDISAKSELDKAVLLRKARSWSYEREWRLIGKRGLIDSIFELEDVTFGFRCPSEVKWAVFSALRDRSRTVNFYEIREVHGKFTLKRHQLDTDELGISYPRRARDATDVFIPNNLIEGPSGM
ncbi:MAG: DUF2971 domain-containing protein [Rhodoferax sp.]|nr:MAG: DUF2971 domain-containing protein [Rhodoferax sp.]